jgi:hypothetical protein
MDSDSDSSSSSSSSYASSSSEERRYESRKRKAIIAKLEAQAVLWGGKKLTRKQAAAMRKAFYKARAMGYTLPQMKILIMRAIR